MRLTTALERFRGIATLPFDVLVGRIAYRIDAYQIEDLAHQRKIWILGAGDLRGVVWLRRNVFLADTFFNSRTLASEAFASGFIPGDQETGELSIEQRTVISSLELKGYIVGSGY